VGEAEAKTSVDGGQLGRRYAGQLEAAGVVDHGSPGTEDMLNRAVGFVAVADFGDSPHRQLGGQTKLSPHGVIGKLMQVEGPKGPCLPGNRGEPVTNRVESFQRRGKRGGGLVIDTHFASHGFHQPTVLFVLRRAASSPS
jgi:hypothetical protein